MSVVKSQLEIDLIDDVSGPAKKVLAALKQTAAATKAAEAAMSKANVSDKFAASLRRIGAEAPHIEAVSAAWRQYATASNLAAKSSEWTKAQQSSVRSWERAQILSLKNVQREEASFARARVKAQAAAEVAQARKPTRAARLREAVGAYGLGAGSGQLAAVVGGGFLVHHAGAAAAARVHEQARMKASGMSASEIAEAETKSARIAAKYPAIGQTDVLHMLRNARSIVGSYHEAAHVVDQLAQLRVVAQGARPGQDISEDFDQLVKGLEIKGVTQNPKQFHDYMEGIAKGLNVFGDTLKPYQYYEMFKYGRQATPGLSEKFILGTAPTLAQELGGSSYGNAVSAFNRAVVGGRMEHSSLKELARLGLVAPGDLDKTRTGSVKGLKPGKAVQGWQLAQSDPNEWVKQYLLPAMTKAGITNTDEIIKEAGTLFSNRSAAQMVGLLLTQQNRIDKDMALLGHAPGLSAANTYMTQDPKIAWQGLKNSLESLAGTMGSGLATILTPAMNNAAQAISNFVKRLDEYNPEGRPAGATPFESPGQKKFNRYMNKQQGFDSDLPFSDPRNDFKKSEAAVAEATEGFAAKKKRLAELQRLRTARDAALRKPFFLRNSAESNAIIEGGKVEADYNALKAEIARVQKIIDVHAEYLEARKKLDDFQRSLPRNMGGIGGEDTPWGKSASDAAAGKWRNAGTAGTSVPGGAMFTPSLGYGGYDPKTGAPGGGPAAPAAPAPMMFPNVVDPNTIDAQLGQFDRMRDGAKAALSGVKEDVDATKSSLSSLGAPVAINVDGGSLKAVLGTAQELEAVLARLGGAVSGAVARAGQTVARAHAAIPALGPTRQGHFGVGGVQGE